MPDDLGVRILQVLDEATEKQLNVHGLRIITDRILPLVIQAKSVIVSHSKTCRDHDPYCAIPCKRVDELKIALSIFWNGQSGKEE